MKLTVKILQGAECTVDVEGYEHISKIKQQVATKLDIPVYCQRLVFCGKTLTDTKKVSESGLRNGGKIFLVVKKDEGLHKQPNLWEELHRVLKKHFKEPDCTLVLEQMKKDYQANVDSLSLDDIERMAHDRLQQQQS